MLNAAVKIDCLLQSSDFQPLSVGDLGRRTNANDCNVRVCKVMSPLGEGLYSCLRSFCCCAGAQLSRLLSPAYLSEEQVALPTRCETSVFEGKFDIGFSC
jgi:hypothetical protein